LILILSFSEKKGKVFFIFGKAKIPVYFPGLKIQSFNTSTPRLTLLKPKNACNLLKDCSDLPSLDTLGT
jgi:hypothetical protein